MKIHIHEHSLRGSKSAIINHINEARHAGEEGHEICAESTFVIGQQKNLHKRKFIESTIIKAKAQRLCNTGGSLIVSDMWNPCLSHVVCSLTVLD